MNVDRRSRLFDVAVASVAAIVVVTGVAIGDEAGARDDDALGYLLAVASAVPLVVRRRAPVVCLAAVATLDVAYHAANYSGGPPYVPFVVALYTTAASGHRAVAGFAAVGLTGAGLGYQVVAEDTDPFDMQILAQGALAAAALFLGEAARHRRAWLAEVQDRMRRADEDREREATRRVTEERLRIARELHDVLAHTVSLIALQSGVAQDTLDVDREATRVALGRIREASREAMAEMRATVGLLRGDGDHRSSAPSPPAPGLAQLDGLITLADSAGLHVELVRDGNPIAVPAAVDVAAYRIVQESLTNVVRHAGASTAIVSLRYRGRQLEVEVRDDGRGPDANSPGESDRGDRGHGILGMRERAETVGGQLTTRSAPEGGFVVHAVLPT